MDKAKIMTSRHGYDSIYSADVERLEQEIRMDSGAITRIARELCELRAIVNRLSSDVYELKRRPPIFFVEGDR